MAVKQNQKSRSRMNLKLLIAVSSVAIASHILPINALEIHPISRQFQLAKTPDERQPEAVQQGIEQIPVAEPPVTPQRTESINSPLPVRVPAPETNPNLQPTATNSTPETSPAASNPTPQPSQTQSVSPTLNTNSTRGRNSRTVAAANSRTPNYRDINFVDIAFGILDKRDFQAQGRAYHFYQFEGRENQLIQIRLLGSADKRRSNNLSLRPYMFLLDPNNNVILKRGGGETERDAFIFARLPVAGVYTIAVTSQNPGDTGRYSLAIRDDRASYILDETGELSQQNLVLKQNGTPYNVKEFQGKKNQLVSIRVDSLNEEFLPYIVLLDAQGQRIAANSDRNGKYSTLIDRARLPEDGTYYIVVTSSNPNQRGNYRLTLF
ncbi:pre-peptidase C-terminal domain-containing protein [Nostoc sp. FACHB-87]|uniref:pre-peptidase C-terminal domain-containing protein n=1 Tax=Nostocaceae TaxID=1162 RepID=UPI001688A121|nr:MULTISPECIES: pre-peptidase C-terminal domain-containing protein [Nostocaceae]MBD2457408.1 pre-peptidase C-terminal domain-containing protein [Nostoc sp. FACHB-87]MBD2476631.1 pre-peptidase C-terminal domain-containing protein [Anabaena sp. FACHB-83]